MLTPSHPYKYKVFGIGISIPLFLLSTTLIFLLYIASTVNMSNSIPTPVPASSPQDFHFEYTVQKGIFMQSEEETDDEKFDFKEQNFGLIERNYPTDDVEGKEEKEDKIWKRFERYVNSIVENAKEGESYKVLFLGRHGQGWHNVAESKYGTKAWDCYYSHLNGSDGLHWADALLTPLGQQQALSASSLWSTQLPLGLPPPETYYVSPLTRTIETADLTFQSLPLPKDNQYKPYIKELLREALGLHTCDRRSSKSHIETTFPHVTFEPGFEEEDGLWEADYREPASAREYRLATLLDDVFASDGGTFLSFTSHSGAIASILRAVGHRTFKLETGGVIPVFLKAERREGKRVVPPKEPSEAPPMCDGPPDV